MKKIILITLISFFVSTSYAQSSGAAMGSVPADPADIEKLPTIENSNISCRAGTPNCMCPTGSTENCVFGKTSNVPASKPAS